MKYIVSILLFCFSATAFAQITFTAAPTYKFQTRLPVARLPEFTQQRIPLPILETRNEDYVKIYAHDQLKNVFIRTPQQISLLNRANYFHNGVALKGNDGRQYFQMVQTLPNKQESIAGWISADQLLNPPKTSALTATNTFFSTTSRCWSCGAANAIQSLGDAVGSYVYPNSGYVPPPPVVIRPRDPNDKPGCPIPVPFTARQTGKRGMRVHPILRINRMHHGSDWAPANPRTPLVSMMPGRVISAGIAGGHGYRVAIQHEDGTISSYSHLQIPLPNRPGCALPAEGAQVGKGAPLGCMGTTGLSTGVHLHLELYASRADYDAKKSMVQENWADFNAACAGRFTR